MKKNYYRLRLACLVAIAAGGPFAHPTKAQTAVVYPPKTNNSTYFVCYDTNGNPASGCPITLTTAPVSQTNGHLHEGPAGYPVPPHPVSGLCSGTCSVNNPAAPTISGFSDSQGNFNYQVATTLVGQSENINATSSLPPYSFTFSYTVGYGDLIFASNPTGWSLVGGSDSGANTGHGTNAFDHWMLPATYNALVATANAWATTKKRCMICINDSALPYGGKFDINVIVPYVCTATPNHPCDTPIPSYGNYRPWVKPHSMHDRGTAVDVNSSGGTICPYPVDIKEFAAACSNNGFGGTGYTFAEGNHPHCGLAMTFPH